MKPLVSMREALADDELFGSILAGPSWHVWRILLVAMMGEPLTDDERTIFHQLTNRDHEPLQPVEEFWGVVGRRGGKTRAMSVLSAYLAALCDWKDVLVPGERGRLSYLASTMKQASIAFQYTNAIFTDLPLFAQMVTNQSSEVISLNNRIDMEIRASSWRSIRGVTNIAALFDELAFFATDEISANADRDILNATRPSLATTRGPLIAISSPYGKRGEVYRAVEEYHKPDADPLILVARGSSLDFNPSLDQSVIDKALKRDPVAARAEYLGEFRDDVAAFIDLATVEACIAPADTDGRPIELRPPRRNANTHELLTYWAFVDPSGGRNDPMTMCIAHSETRESKEGRPSEGKREKRDVVVIDRIDAVHPPFKPNRVVWDFAKTLKDYGIRTVVGDDFAAEWVRDEFQRAGIQYHKSSLNRSEIYLNFLPLLTERRVELLNHDGLVSELTGLQRRVSSTGREAVDHKQGRHDDVANAVAGAATLIAEKNRRLVRTKTLVTEVW